MTGCVGGNAIGGYAPQVSQGLLLRTVTGVRRSTFSPAYSLAPLFLALVISAAGGGLSIPHGDSWAYSKVARGFAANFQFELVNWNRPGLVGQSVLAVPLSHILPNPVLAQQLTVWVLSVLLVLGTYWFFEPVLGPGRAALAAGVTGLFPGLGLLATSFMADVPAAALGMLCLVAGARAFDTLPTARGWVWLTASMALGWLAGTSREQALAAPVAVLLWLGVRMYRDRQRRSDLPRLAAVGLAFLTALVATEWWRRTLPHGDAPAPPVFSHDSVYVLVRAGLVLGLVLLPASILAIGSLRGRIRGRTVTIGTVLAVTTTALAVLGLFFRWVKGRPEPLLPGNYLGARGPYLDAGVAPPDAVMPSWLWVLVALVGGVSLIVVVLALTLRPDRGHAAGRWHGLPVLADGRLGLAATFLALCAGGTALQTIIGQSFFDRYLLPMVPLTAGLVLAALPTQRRPGVVLASAASAAALAVLGLVIVAAGTAYDTARWQAATAIVDNGVPPTDVAAGLEWSGWHATGPYQPRPSPPNITWWSFPGSRDCWVVAGRPLTGPGLTLHGTVEYQRLLVAVPDQLFIYRNARC